MNNNFDKISVASNITLNISEVKNFYLNYLINILKKPLIEGILSLYKSVSSSNNPELFKEVLLGIKSLTKQQILDEVRRIKVSANLLNDKLINIINCVFKSYIILLIFNETKAKNFILSDDYLRNINSNDFIYLCYKELAQNIAFNLSPIYDYINNKNTNNLIVIIKNSIEKTIFDLLPIDDIMNYYLNNILTKDDNTIDSKISEISQYIVKTNKKFNDENNKIINDKIILFSDKINDNISILNTKIQKLENTINDTISKLEENNTKINKSYDSTNTLKNSISRVKANSKNSLNSPSKSIQKQETPEIKKTILLEKTPERNYSESNTSTAKLSNSPTSSISSKSKTLSIESDSVISSISSSKKAKKEKVKDISLSSLVSTEKKIKTPVNYPITNLQKTILNKKNNDKIKTTSISLNSIEVSKLFDP